jgi:hypothetical protein
VEIPWYSYGSSCSADECGSGSIRPKVQLSGHPRALNNRILSSRLESESAIRLLNSDSIVTRQHPTSDSYIYQNARFFIDQVNASIAALRSTPC